MGDRLKGKVAIVTGAGGGIGRGHALALASEGAKVVVNDLGGAVDGSGSSSSAASKVAEEIKAAGGEAVANHDSVTSVEGGENIIKTAVDAFGKLDILVNNAGILRDRMVFNMSPEEWDSVIKVHLYGHFNTTRPACVLFRQQRSGRIINTSSTSGLGNRGQSNYAAAKEGIVGFTRTVAIEMGRYGVTCNAIRPNAGTRMTMSDDMKQAAERSGRGEIVKYMESMKPEDIAPLIVWLASDDSANVNGRTFFVQTGRIALFSEPVQEKVIEKQGGFTIDELFEKMPKTLAEGLVNASPPEQPKE
ncbi:MAG TPA: SDR family NAD(P)-dependent oxidoreductase [Dehalococcoidales bacterium]|nr:SDR family NAD(P)-dependent oxidoreductase [Dehalococcoidales bacterium]